MVTIEYEDGLWDQGYTVYTYTMPSWVWDELQGRGYDHTDVHLEGIPEELEQYVKVSETHYR